MQLTHSDRIYASSDVFSPAPLCVRASCAALGTKESCSGTASALTGGGAAFLMIFESWFGLSALASVDVVVVVALGAVDSFFVVAGEGCDSPA